MPSISTTPAPLPVMQPMKAMPLVDGSYLIRFIAPQPGEPLDDPMTRLEGWMRDNHMVRGTISAGVGSATGLTLATPAKQTFNDPSYEATGIQGSVDLQQANKVDLHLVLGDKNKTAHAGSLASPSMSVPAVLEFKFTPDGVDASRQGTPTDVTGTSNSPLRVERWKNGTYTVSFVAPATHPIHDPMSLFTAWMADHQLPGGILTGSGQIANLTLATWDAGQKSYTTLKLTDPSYQAVGFNGNMAWATDAAGHQSVAPHLHTEVLGGAAPSDHMGHIVGAFDAYTLTFDFTPSVAELHRGVSAGTGGPALEP